MAGINAEAAGIHDPGNSETIELREELPGSGDILFEIGPRQAIEQRGDTDDGAVEPARGFARCGTLGRDPGRQLIRGDPEGLLRLRRHQQRRIEQLDVGRIVGHGRHHLGERRPPLLRKLQVAPATGHDDPGRRARFGRLAQAFHGFANGLCADPVDLGGVGEAGAHGVNMGIDQSRNDRASAGVDAARRGPDQAFHGIVAANCNDLAVADGERLRDRRCRIQRHDLCVRDNEVGRLCVSRSGPARDHQNRQKLAHVQSRNERGRNERGRNGATHPPLDALAGIACRNGECRDLDHVWLQQNQPVHRKIRSRPKSLISQPAFARRASARQPSPLRLPFAAPVCLAEAREACRDQSKASCLTH